MLYWGEGAKSGSMSLGNSSPDIIKFYIAAVSQCYQIPLNKLRFDLHLRADQSAEIMKNYWLATLNLPAECFRAVSYDKRTQGKPTYPYYKAVCQVYYGTISLQRCLHFLYTHYCKNVTSHERARSSVG